MARLLFAFVLNELTMDLNTTTPLDYHRVGSLYKTIRGSRATSGLIAPSPSSAR